MAHIHMHSHVNKNAKKKKKSLFTLTMIVDCIPKGTSKLSFNELGIAVHTFNP